MISSTVNRMQYAGAGSTGPYPFAFRIFAATDLVVTKRSVAGVETALVYLTDFVLTAGTTVGDGAGGNITLTVALATGEVLTIRRVVPLTQPVSLANQAAYFGATHETEFDRLVAQVQQLDDRVRRSVGVRETYDPATLALLVPAGETGKVLGWDSSTTLTNKTLDSSAVALPGEGRTVATLSAYLSNNRVYNVKDFGAVGNGTTDDRAALVLAAAAGSLYFPSGTYRIATSLTITPGVTFAPGAVVTTDAGQTVTFSGTIHASPTYQIVGGAGSFVINRITTPKVYAAWFAGSDVGAKINAAVAALTTGGQKGPGTIVVNSDSNTFATQIDLTNTKLIRITSEGGNPNSVTDWGPNLIWTGGAGSGAAVKAPGSIALEWSYLNLSYNNAAYDGNLFSLSSSGGATNTSLPHIHHCRLSGTPTAKLAARLIELNTTLQFSIDNVTLDYAVDGIGCSGGSNNAIDIGANVWFNLNFTGAQIRGWGGAWNIGAVVAESGNNGAAALVPFFKLAGGVNGLHFNGCMCIDGGSGGGTLIDLTASTVSGLKMSGGNYTATSGTLLRCSDTAGATQGINLGGVYASGMATGLHFGRANGIAFDGNTLHCTTPWTGTEPTRMRPGVNDLGTTAGAAGVSVADGSNVALTPPGSAADGAGKVYVWEHVDGAHAVYNLNGGGGTTTEVEDLGAIFTPTVNNLATTNIYYDAGTASYRLQNKRGAARLYTVTYVGR